MKATKKIVQPDDGILTSVESFDAHHVQPSGQSTGITQLMRDLSISDMSATNSSNVRSQSTGLTQKLCDLAISDDVLSFEESNELLVDIFPITDSSSCCLLIMSKIGLICGKQL